MKLLNLKRTGFWRLALGLALPSVLSGCLVNEIVNEAPVPGIRVIDSGPYRVGQIVSFDATKSVDDDRAGLVAKWQALSCVDGREPQECIGLGDEQQLAPDKIFAVEIVSHETIRVQLRVTDALGATRQAPDVFTIDVSNREPEIGMQVTGYREGASGPFVIERPITLIAIPEDLALGLVDSDGDELELNWQLLPPVGSSPLSRSFAPLGEDGHVLVPDIAGEWGVKLTASDGHGGSAAVEKNFVVGPDGPPCLLGMDPQPIDDAYYLVDSADGSRRFSVLSVLDALDPYPAALDNDPALGEASFRWFLQEPGSASVVELFGHNGASYLVDPMVYSPGDSLVIRVEVSDRVQGPARVLPCAADDWSCQLNTGSGCFQRQSWGVQIQ